MMNKYFVTAAALFLLSCSASQFGWKRESESAKKESKESPYVEDFDPSSINDDDINPAMDKALLLSAKETKTNKLVIEPEKTTAETNVNGYRVQLLATKDKDQADEMKRQAILKLEEKTYLIYEIPYYKIRVGDFINEKDAKLFRDEAVKKGFSAWVVQCKVNSRGHVESNP